jgi:hypothetical protein
LTTKSSYFALGSATLFTYQLSPTDGVTTIMPREGQCTKPAARRERPRGVLTTTVEQNT